MTHLRIVVFQNAVAHVLFALQATVAPQTYALVNIDAVASLEVRVAGGWCRRQVLSVASQWDTVSLGVELCQTGAIVVADTRSILAIVAG